MYLRRSVTWVVFVNFLPGRRYTIELSLLFVFGCVFFPKRMNVVCHSPYLEEQYDVQYCAHEHYYINKTFHNRNV